MFLIFLEGVKIISVDLKLKRPLLQHCSLFVKHNRSEISHVVSNLPVPIGYDCVYDSICNSSSPLYFE